MKQNIACYCCSLLASMFNADAVHEVPTGQVLCNGAGALIVANALGSCIAVAAFDPPTKQGGIAHVMLPGKARRVRDTNRFRYAEDAIDELIRRMETAGCRRERLCFVVAGGANVLQRPDDRVCETNIHSVLSALQRRGIPILARDLGGFQRRRVTLDPGAGIIYCAVGDDRDSVLWKCGDNL